MIHVRELVKRFGELTAVDGISFDVRAGEIFAFLGPNGAGKTTTIQMLTTLLRPTSGRITLDELDPTTHQHEVRKRFGIVFQDPSLDGDMTAAENMELHGVLYHVPRKVRLERTEMLLTLFELWDRRHSAVKAFSGGMKRRLEIARGLLHTPKILFLDEPTLGLDPQSRNQLWTHVKHLNETEGMTVFLGPVFQQSGRGSYLQFVAPGVIGMSILFMSIFSGIGLLFDRQFGFLKETLVAPVPRLHIMIGRTLGGATVATMQGVLILVVCVLAGFRPQHLATVPIALVFMALIAIVFTAFGTAIGSTLKDMQGFQLIMNFLVMPIFFLSGALFPLANLPAPLAVATMIDPLSYGVDGLRGAFIGVSHFGLVTDVSVLAIVAATFLGLGAWTFSRIQV